MFLFAARAPRLLRAGILRMVLVAIVSCPQQRYWRSRKVKGLQRPGDIKSLGDFSSPHRRGGVRLPSAPSEPQRDAISK